jgi:hypothetical protein
MAAGAGDDRVVESFKLFGSKFSISLEKKKRSPNWVRDFTGLGNLSQKKKGFL